MRIFLSFAGLDRSKAETLAVTLREDGHEVFHDHGTLEAGEAFDRRIRQAIRRAHCVVFFLRPESVAPGSYPRAELSIIERRWPASRGRVLVVETAPVEPSLVPAYLGALHRLRARGELVAEVSDLVARVATARRRTLRMLLGAGLLIVALGTATLVRCAGPTLTHITLESARVAAEDLLVDSDDIIVRWSSAGPATDLRVCLQNLDTQRRTREIAAGSTDGTVRIPVADYRALLVSRERGTVNRIRALVQTGEELFTSATREVHVGIKVMLVVFPEKLKVGAMIDNRLIPFYDFEARIVVPHRDDASLALSLGDRFQYGQSDFPGHDPAAYDWSRARCVYLGPDDPRLVTFEAVFD